MKTSLSTIVVLLCAYAMFATASPIPLLVQEDGSEINVFAEEAAPIREYGRDANEDTIMTDWPQEVKVALVEALEKEEEVMKGTLAAKYEDPAHAREEHQLVTAFKKWGDIEVLLEQPAYELLEGEAHQKQIPEWAQKILAMHSHHAEAVGQDSAIVKLLEEARNKINHDITACAAHATKDIAPQGDQVMTVEIPKGALRMSVDAGTAISVNGLQATTKSGRVMDVNLQLSRRLSEYPLHDVRRRFMIESLEPSPCEARSWSDVQYDFTSEKATLAL